MGWSLLENYGPPRGNGDGTDRAPIAWRCRGPDAGILPRHKAELRDQKNERAAKEPLKSCGRLHPITQSHRFDDSGSVRGAAKRLQPGFLVVQQATCAAAREVPVTPIAFLEPVALSQQPGCDATLRRAGELREGFE